MIDALAAAGAVAAAVAAAVGGFGAMGPPDVSIWPSFIRRVFSDVMAHPTAPTTAPAAAVAAVAASAAKHDDTMGGQAVRVLCNPTRGSVINTTPRKGTCYDEGTFDGHTRSLRGIEQRNAAALDGSDVT